MRVRDGSRGQKSGVLARSAEDSDWTTICPMVNSEQSKNNLLRVYSLHSFKYCSSRDVQQFSRSGFHYIFKDLSI